MIEETNVERGADAVDVPGDYISTKIPSSTFLVAMAASVLASVSFYIAGKKDTALFVGLWAPTLLQFGIYNKMLRISRGTAQVTH